MEAIAMTLIAFVAYIMLKNTETATNIIPFLGVLALSGQKLLPALQQIFKSWTSLQSTHQSVYELLNLIKEPIEDINLKDNSKPLLFSNNITFKNVSFKYDLKSRLILNKINFKINKGEMIGIVGKTGGGKSTSIDLIMGLLIPTSGKILIDGKVINKKDKSIIYAWQKNIAHVPQNIYISDASFAENIAFGIPKENIDFKRLIYSAEKANIREYIESLPKKYNTVLGERGSKISGGQKQRIGIARALYQQKEILILDEPTSSLDAKTESFIVKSIKKLPSNITIIMISHRKNTLKNCDQIITIKDGEISNIDFNFS